MPVALGLGALRRDPDEPGDVVGRVLDPSCRRAAVELGRGALPERRPRRLRLADHAHRLGGAGALRSSAPGWRSRMKRAHWASGWGWETTPSIRSSAIASRAISRPTGGRARRRS